MGFDGKIGVTDLSVHDGCLLGGNRVVIPPTGRQQAMDLFHNGHPGASRMKSLARSYIWWPDMDRDLEIRVKECEACQRARNQPPVSPLMPWELPQTPWERLHGEFAGPYEGKMFFDIQSPLSLYSKFEDLSIEQQHYKWIDHIRQTMWYRTNFENEMLASNDALMLHWKRTCWILHMWNQADNNQMVLQPITEYGWNIKSDVLTIQWDTENNEASIRE